MTHATVFEFVNLAKRYGHRGVANLVNAVLRSFLRERPLDPTRDLFESDDEYLGTRYSLPTWLVRQWRGVFGAQIEAICAAVNDPARSAVSVNTMRTNVPEVVERFATAGIVATRSAFAPDSLLVDDAAKVRALESQAKGAWWVQSESSAMPVEVLHPQPGEAILDVASGRGNKALQIGARLGGEGNELCIERDPRKAKVLGGQAGGGRHRGRDRRRRRHRGAAPAEPALRSGADRRAVFGRWRRGAPSRGPVEEAAGRRRTPSADAAGFARGVGSVDARGGCARVRGLFHRSTGDDRSRRVVPGKANVERGLVPAAFEPFITEQGDVLVPPGLDGRDGFFIARLGASVAPTPHELVCTNRAGLRCVHRANVR